MIIGGLQKNTLIDYPGKIACVIFTSGCNFYCPWCYSSELVVPEKIKRHPKIEEKEVLSFLKSRKGLLEGVVICGGEPTLNKDLPEFIKKIKKLGFSVKLDTNGSNPRMLKSLIDKKLVNYVAMDIKGSFGQKFGGKGDCKINKFEKEIKESIRILKKSKISFQFRMTVVPSIHTKENILEAVQLIKGPDIVFYLQNFRPEKTIDPEFEKIRPYPDEWLLDIKKEISPFFKICEIR
ncbi:MAG: anaerobic ribonucleoside-triphosphate reductase activating protein [Candidatus Staskawiczbacteria bacterium]|jgi:pyruvate formate lyase activating enzyme